MKVVRRRAAKRAAAAAHPPAELGRALLAVPPAELGRAAEPRGMAEARPVTPEQLVTEAAVAPPALAQPECPP